MAVYDPVYFYDGRKRALAETCNGFQREFIILCRQENLLPFLCLAFMQPEKFFYIFKQVPGATRVAGGSAADDY